MKWGGVNYFTVMAFKRDEDRGRNMWSVPSPLVRAQPRVADDLVASVKAANEVALAWQPVADAVGYHVERAPVEVLTDDQILRLKKDTPPLPEPAVGAVKLIGKFETLT